MKTLINKSWLTGMCDKVREATGETGLITIGDNGAGLCEKIGTIPEPMGVYAWKKCDSSGNFIEYVVDNDETAYPESGTGGDGYVYEMVKSGTPLSEFAVGDSVFLNVDGTPTEFLVVQRGKPSSEYDDTCNGTWLLMKDAYTKQIFDTTDNDYGNSDVHTYLNNDFLSLFDSGVQSAIKQVKIPYYNGTGSNGSIASGSNGLSTKIFLLSFVEIGGYSTSTYDEPHVYGAMLSYFESGDTTSAKSKRKAKYNNEDVYWWLRDPLINNQHFVWMVNGYDGAVQNQSRSLSYGVRPMFILPDNFVI